MKHIRLMMSAVAAVMMTFAAQAEKTAKAVVENDGKTLRFVYDSVDYDSQGKTWYSLADYEETASYVIPEWHAHCGTVTNAVFDPSFAVCKPKKCYDWFYEFTQLVGVEGLENLDTSETTSFVSMFDSCSSLTSLDLSSLDTSKVTDMSWMFYDCSSLTSLDLSSFDTSKVTDMSDMFEGCSSLVTLDVTSFDTANVTGMDHMFYGCSSLEAICASDRFVTDQVSYSSSMFKNCSKLVGGAGTAYDSTKTDKTYARIDGEGGQPGYFTRGYAAKGVVGEYGKWTLPDLGIEPPAAGTVYSVKAYGLPSGLKLKYNAAKKDKKGKVIVKAKTDWWIEGVPTAACDFTQQPVYAVVTSGGKTTWQPLALSVAPQAVTDLEPLALGESVNTNAFAWLPGVASGWSVSGLPTGLKFTSKAVYKDKKKKTVKYPAYTVYGKTTKAGLFTVTAKKKRGSYYETLKYRVLVEPKAVDVSLFGESLTNLVTTAYEAYSNAVPVKVDKVTGLPAGLAFAAKNVYGYKDAKKKKGKYLKQAAQTIVGKPTKAGTYVVTYTKNVKSGKKTVAKTAQVLWTVLPSPVVPTADFNVSGGIVLNRNAGSSYATSSAAAMTFGVTPGASVSASGLPKGLSLKKVSDGTWAIVGTPSKTGTSYVTVTVKLNGNTVKQSLAIQVSAHPLAGKYSGYVTLSGRYLGSAKLTVSSVGKVSLSLVENGVKTSATLSKVTAVEESPDDPAAGKWKCAFTLKAYKKGGREVLPKRTLTLVFERKSGEWELPTCSPESYRTSAGELFAYVCPCRELSKAEIAARVAAGRIPELPSVETLAIPAGISGSSQGEAVAAGEVVTVSAVYKASTATYTVTGRLPDGKTFSASAPVLWCGFDEPSHDAIGLDYILVANGAGDKYELLIALPYYGDFSPEARVKFCYYKQLWGNGQYWEAGEFRSLFGDGDPWTKLPGTVSAALGEITAEGLPLDILWRAAELPGEPDNEELRFKILSKTVTEKKKKVTKHYASVSADDGATWVTSKDPITWTAGRASFSVKLGGHTYAFDLALDKNGELIGWARKSHTKYDKKKKKNVTVVDAVGTARVCHP